MKKLIATLFVLLSCSSAYAGGCSDYGYKWLPTKNIDLGSFGIYIYGECGTGNCYNIGVGSHDSNVTGNGSNCGDSSDGFWSVIGCGHSSSANGGPGDAVQKIVELCGK